MLAATLTACAPGPLPGTEPDLQKALRDYTAAHKPDVVRLLLRDASTFEIDTGSEKWAYTAQGWERTSTYEVMDLFRTSFNLRDVNARSYAEIASAFEANGTHAGAVWVDRDDSDVPAAYRTGTVIDETVTRTVRDGAMTLAYQPIHWPMDSAAGLETAYAQVRPKCPTPTTLLHGSDSGLSCHGGTSYAAIGEYADAHSGKVALGGTSYRTPIDPASLDPARFHGAATRVARDNGVDPNEVRWFLRDDDGQLTFGLTYRSDRGTVMCRYTDPCADPV